MAEVFKLPTAATEKVIQPQRRGRLPKSIASMHDGLYRRYKREQAERTAEESVHERLQSLVILLAVAAENIDKIRKELACQS